MTDKEMQDLEKIENWDYESAEKRGRVKTPRAIVSVAFSREDFERVVQCAEQMGMRTSEFIREAALDKALHRIEIGRRLFTSINAGWTLYMEKPVPTTQVSGGSVPVQTPEVVTM